MPLKYRIKRDLLVYAIKRFIFECIIAYPFLISFQVLNILRIVLPPPLHYYSPEIDKNLIIHCYQPEPGYCACVLQVADQ